MQDGRRLSGELEVEREFAEESGIPWVDSYGEVLYVEWEAFMEYDKVDTDTEEGHFEIESLGDVSILGIYSEQETVTPGSHLYTFIDKLVTEAANEAV